MAERTETTPSSPARRFTDATERFATVIGPMTSIRGELTGEDPVEVAGTLEGESHVAAHYLVREGGRVSGAIQAASLVVAGEVKAPTLFAEKIEIRATGRVQADLRARVVAIAEGARFDGSVHTENSGAAGPTVFKERRAPLPGEEPSKR